MFLTAANQTDHERRAIMRQSSNITKIATKNSRDQIALMADKE